MKPPTEHQIQAAYMEWVAFMANQDWRYQLIYAIPNEGKRTLQAQRKMKAEGMKKGVLDVNIDFASKGFNGARIEFKTPKGKLTKYQLKMSNLYNQAGYLAVVCRSVDQAIHFTETYMDKPR